MDFIVFLNKNLKQPLYFQLYSYIKKEIEAGSLVAGVKMPPIRQLAIHLRVSKTTIETAYQQLVAEGYLESRAKSGIWVSPQEEIGLATQSIKHEDDFSVVNEATVRYNFEYGDIAVESFPIKKWKRSINEALSTGRADLLLYGERQGSLVLREELAKYLNQSRGISCSPGQIVITAGTQPAISTLCQLLSLSGQRVAFENPGYDGVRTVFANLGCSLSPVTLEEDGINIGELENTGANLVYVTPAHQFPLGMVLSIQKRKKLLQWAESGERFIIEDDYDSEFRYSSQPIPPLKAMDYDDKVIYLGTFSKAFMPGARLSYIILPQQLSSLFKTKLANYNQSSPPLIQNGLELFMKQGDFERHIRKMRKVYQQKHRMLTASINLYMGNRIEMIGQKAGLHLLINVDNRDFMDLKERGLQQEVLIHSPEKFWINRGDCPKSLVMLGFGGLTEMEIREGIERLGKAWF